MTLLIFIGLGIAFCFSFVVLFGAPYLPTLNKQLEISLDLLDLQPGQTMLELGCGDGRVLVAAAERGWNVVGYELNPILACLAWLRTRKFGRNVRVVCGNFWWRKWPVTDGIFGFILPRYMSKLDKKVIQECRKPVKVVSFAFAIQGRKPTKKKDGVFMYVYR
ncbi:MAG: class I SAM-dependent methyltransferase [Candidatus Saccharimonadales bacterium]